MGPAAVALGLAALVAAPGSLNATLRSPEYTAYGVADARERLETTRERMAVRQALRDRLSESVGELSRAIGEARRAAERTAALMSDHREALRRQEVALDRIVPRLLARLDTLERRRTRAAGALADIATLSRRQELDRALRARMRAIGPVLLAMVRESDAQSMALSRQHEDVIERQRQLAARLPVLQAEHERQRVGRRQLLDQRSDALQRLAQLDVELGHLSGAVEVAGQRLHRLETAHAARAEPAASQPAHDPFDPVRGGMMRGQPARLAAGSVGAASLGSTTPARASLWATASPLTVRLRARLEPDLGVRLAALPGARPLPSESGKSLVRGSTGPAGKAAAAPARPASVAMVADRLSSRVAAASLPPPASLRPSPELVAARGRDFDSVQPGAGPGGGGMMIAALPGQPVAAPKDGRIVFADAFKSYGLLLIIEHESEYHTLLWGFSRLRVGVGDKVHGGEVVGVMDVIDGLPPRLGVELRRRGRPIDPLPWLAGSSSKVRG